MLWLKKVIFEPAQEQARAQAEQLKPVEALVELAPEAVDCFVVNALQNRGWGCIATQQ